MTYTSESIINALIASGGDAQLVAEEIRATTGQEISPSEILVLFINAVNSPDGKATDGVRALLLLNLLGLLNDAKAQMQASLAEFSATELTRTVQLVIEGIAQLLPQQQPQQTQTTINNNFLNQIQTETEQARNRVQARLETYNKLGEAYNESPSPTPINSPNKLRLVENDNGSA